MAGITKLRQKKQQQNLSPARKKSLQKRIDMMRKDNQNPKTDATWKGKVKGLDPSKGNKPDVSGGRAPGVDNNAKPNPTGELAGEAPDPRDDQYFLDIARLNFEKNQAISDINTEGIYAKTSYEDATDASQRSERDQLLSTKEAANRGGAFYSSRTANTLGEVQRDALLQRLGLERDFQYGEAGRASALHGIEGSYLIDSAQAQSNTVGRAVAAELDRPSPVSPDPANSADVLFNQADRAKLSKLQKRLKKASPNQRKKLKKAIKELKKKK
jgi:hypothetical protein